MAKKTIEIVFQAIDKASKVIANLGKASENAADNLDDLNDASNNTSKDVKGLEGAAKALGTVLSVAAVTTAAKAVWQLGELGAQSKRTSHAFKMISGSASEANVRLDAMRVATRGAMSEQQMMASANQLMQMGLANNADELENITKMAVKLGGAMGNKAGPSIEAFSMMLANQSIPRLDTFGMSSGKVRARIIELQAATEGMSREQAFMTAVMEEGSKAMERLGADVEDDALAFERLEANTADLKAALAEMLAPAIAKVAGGLADVTAEINEQNRTIKEYEQTLGREAVASAYVAAQYKGQSDALSNLDEQYRKTAAASELSAGQMADYAAMAGETTIITNEAAAAQTELATAASTVAKSFGEMEFDNESLWNLALASGASVEALGALALQLGIANSAEVQASMKSYELVEAFGAGTLSAKEYADQMARLASMTSEANARLDAIEARGGMAEGGRTRYQHGTMNHPGGMALVGEAGPEALWMPPGSQVHSNQSATTQRVMNDNRKYSRTVNVGTELALVLEANQAQQEQVARANMLM